MTLKAIIVFLSKVTQHLAVRYGMEWIEKTSYYVIPRAITKILYLNILDCNNFRNSGFIVGMFAHPTLLYMERDTTLQGSASQPWNSENIGVESSKWL